MKLCNCDNCTYQLLLIDSDGYMIGSIDEQLIGSFAEQA